MYVLCVQHKDCIHIVTAQPSVVRTNGLDSRVATLLLLSIGFKHEMSDMAEEAEQCLNSHLGRWHAYRKRQFDAEQPRSLQLMEITCVLQNGLAFLASYSYRKRLMERPLEFTSALRNYST